MPYSTRKRLSGPNRISQVASNGAGCRKGLRLRVALNGSNLARRLAWLATAFGNPFAARDNARMARKQPYHIMYDEATKTHLLAIEPKHHSLIREKIEEQLRGIHLMRVDRQTKKPRPPWRDRDDAAQPHVLKGQDFLDRSGRVHLKQQANVVPHFGVDARLNGELSRK
jgi:hypothetical protein